MVVWVVRSERRHTRLKDWAAAWAAVRALMQWDMRAYLAASRAEFSAAAAAD